MTWPPHRPEHNDAPGRGSGERGRGQAGGAPRGPSGRPGRPGGPANERYGRPAEERRSRPVDDRRDRYRQPLEDRRAAPADRRQAPGAGGRYDAPAGGRYGDDDGDRYGDRYGDAYVEPAMRGAGPGSRRPAEIPPTRLDLPEADEPARPRGGAVRRGVTAVAAVLAAIVLILATTGWAVLRHYDGRVRHVPLTFSAGVERPPRAGGGTQNILLVGSDSRANTGGAFGEAEGQRSDTTILAHLDASGSTTLISFPRDLWVRIPAYTDARGTRHATQRSKLNAAYSYGGPSLLVSTIEGLTGIRVDHYVQIDFIGFQGMTDALGGVTVCIKELPPGLKARGFDNLHDHYSGFSGQVGENRLNGAQALAFVRQRYGLPESDIDRIRRQQQFLGVVFRRLAATDTLLNPARLINVVDAATSALTLDDGTSLADLRLLAVRMQAIGSGGVAFATVPASAGTQGGQSVLVVDPDQLGAFLKPFGGRTGQTSSAGALPARPGAGAAALGAPVSWSRPGAARTVDAATAVGTPAAAAPAAGCTY